MDLCFPSGIPVLPGCRLSSPTYFFCSSIPFSEPCAYKNHREWWQACLILAIAPRKLNPEPRPAPCPKPRPIAAASSSQVQCERVQGCKRREGRGCASRCPVAPKPELAPPLVAEGLDAPWLPPADLGSGLSLSLPSCATLDKSLNPPGPQAHHG